MQGSRYAGRHRCLACNLKCQLEPVGGAVRRGPAAVYLRLPQERCGCKTHYCLLQLFGTCGCRPAVRSSCLLTDLAVLTLERHSLAGTAQERHWSRIATALLLIWISHQETTFDLLPMRPVTFLTADRPGWQLVNQLLSIGYKHPSKPANDQTNELARYTSSGQ